MLLGFNSLSAKSRKHQLILDNEIPKREFRGAWLQCINGIYMGLSTDECKRKLIGQLDALQDKGINAIIFQVRAEADALYQSPYEPWSRFLTGVQGQAPVPFWDPLQFMIDECHKRCMELHAWINPYRAKTASTVASTNHITNRHPERLIQYGSQSFFDPGLPINKKYILTIVEDIVKRYDIDGLHIDDYFYPYPKDGEEIPDYLSFAEYGRGYADKGDWRRDNITKLIEDMNLHIKAIKPWVKFGVSPFGIYRNKKNNVNGSNTNGLQNYDDLYADILQWVDRGLVDYTIPQVYWEMGHPVADYTTLVKWWANNACNRPLYIGQDIQRTISKPDLRNPNMNQLRAKLSLQRYQPCIEGACFWYGDLLANNAGNYGTALKKYYYRYPALQPEYAFIDNKKPKKVKGLKATWTSQGYILHWQEPKAKKEMDKVKMYVVYRFDNKKGKSLDAKNIVTITRNTSLTLPYEDGTNKVYYYVTSLDRLQNESKASVKKVKL